jgi:hypothetical protein
MTLLQKQSSTLPIRRAPPPFLGAWRHDLLSSSAADIFKRLGYVTPDAK